MKKNLITITVIGTLSFIAYYFGNAEILKSKNPDNQNEFKQISIIEQAPERDVAPSDWNTYSNDKLGISFQYPNEWIKNGEDANISDRNGAIVSVNIQFVDNITNTTFLLEYHLAPNGADLYKYAISQFNSSEGLYKTGGQQIEVAGKKAIQANTTISIDGKGNELKTPLRLMVVDFLDMKETGTIELQFKTPLPESDTEVAKFNKLLSTFKFTK